jgi:16S rRNA (cytidine1402-2'-O)-methyltransferase
MSKLYLVPTPIGNLQDMTYRAVEVLNTVSLILAEDTRTTGKLLKHFNIDTPQRSYHMHNEHEIAQRLMTEIAQGASMALVSDAGTPGISDPGFLLVKHAIEAGIPVETLPGATAFVPALVNAGLPNHNFCFEGFLPAKKGRKTRLEALATEKRTMVFYESPHRVLKTLGDMHSYWEEDREASTSREISKKFEDTQRGTLTQLIAHFKANPPKGEFVICVSGKS